MQIETNDICMYNGKLHSHKKNESWSFAATWVDLEGIMLREISQRKTNTLFSTHMCTVKNKTNEQIQQNRNRFLDTEN